MNDVINPLSSDDVFELNLSFDYDCHGIIGLGHKGGNIEKYNETY